MKKTHRRRWLSLLLTLAMCLALAPAALAADEAVIEGGPAAGYMDKRETTTLTLMVNGSAVNEVEWDSSNKDVATVHYKSGLVEAKSPGKTTITAYYGDDQTETTEIIVSGIAVKEGDAYNPVVVYENGDSYRLNNAIDLFGAANERSLEFTSLSPSVAEVNGSLVSGILEGDAEIWATANDGQYDVNIKVHVAPDPTTRIPQTGTISLKSGENKPFGDLLSYFSSQVGGKVEYITGLFVSTSQGTLYYGYQSEAQPGSGVGQMEGYYREPGPGQLDLSRITFVPKPGFAGGDVTITYNAITTDGKTYSCKIELTVQGSPSSSAPGGGAQTNAISLETAYNTALKFDSTEFGVVFREKGTQLDHVVFSQPPERQGTLYTSYYSSDNYGSVVDILKQYSRREIDNIWFVPAPGFSGSVTVYYTGFAANGEAYPGQVIVSVGQEDSKATGGLSFTVFSGSVARFDEDKFDEYCHTVLDDGMDVSGIRFEALPSKSDGVLYYDYQSPNNPGSPVTTGTVYYSGTRTPRINRLAFAPVTGFIGTVKIPFTGWTTDGTSFGGNVEINVRGGVTSGDIYYYCAPSRSVSFRSSDFTSLSRSITTRTLDYISFTDLPDASEGSLYVSSARVSTGTHYDSRDISRMTFRASRTFSGLVIIPFSGRSTGGDIFTGVVTIGSSAAGSGNNTTSSNTSGNTAGSGGSTASSGNLSTIDTMAQYSTRTAPVHLYAVDLAQSGSTLSSIRFTSLPSSSVGYLYYQYSSPTQYGTQVNTSTAYQVSGSGNLISDVAFVPRAGYTGTVTIPYTGTNASGTTFSGEVIVRVESTSSSYYFSDMAGYSSAQIAAVDFLYDHSITHGLTDTQYGPESPIRRGDFALMLYQAFQFFPVSSGSSFTDVSPGAYYAAAVNTLYARGVVSGTGGGLYAPDSTLTRQDAICMVQRAMQAIGWSASDGYAPALAGYGDNGDVSGYAQGAMALAVQRGYLPTSGGLLNPRQALTRVDMAELLHRALTY